MLDSLLAGLCRMPKNFRAVLPQAAVLALLCATLTTFASTSLAQQGTFVPTGSLNTATDNHTATLLSNGKVLIVGGIGGLGSQGTPAELYDPTSGTFVANVGTGTIGAGSSATLLSNGKVLFAGGIGTVLTMNQVGAELYDPATGAFTTTGNMITGRYYPTATRLQSGKILIINGGQCPQGSNNVCLDGNAELYDPTSGTFTATGSLTTNHDGGTATLLNNGMVLVAGGGQHDGIISCTAIAELYNPATGTFTPTGTMNNCRSGHAAMLLNTGRVLIAGGDGFPPNVLLSDAWASAELYDPTTGTFTPTGNMNTPREVPTATLLNNGMVLVAGGLDPDRTPEPAEYLATAEVYDPATGTFTPTGDMNFARADHTATLLNDGTVLVVGGANLIGPPNNYTVNVLSSAELYEQIAVSPASLSFSNQSTGTTSASQTVTLTNNESTALTIGGVSVSGANGSDFVETNDCVGSLPAGASCSISVTFTPAATGMRAASLTIANNLSVSPVLVPLTGTGVPPAPIVSLSSNGVPFATQALGTTSSPQTVTLHNTGTATLNIQTVAITGASAGDFAITNGSTCTNGANVAINGSCTIQLIFTPTGPGTRSATVSITDNAADSPETISLSGTTAPSVSITPSTVTFSSQYVGTSGLPQTVTITNTGTASVTVTAVTASITDFGVLSNCTNVVAAGANCTIGVFFDPTAGGTRTGTLSITDNAAGSPQTITLTGSGQDFSMTPGSASSATVTPGQSASYSIAIAPAGGFAQSVALSCSGGPTQSTCTVSPNLIALGGKSATTAMVTVTTMSSAQGPVLPRGTGWPMEYRQTPLILALIWMSLLMAALLLLMWREQRFRWAPTFALAVLACLGMTLTSCGGGSGGGGGINPQAGTYTITVTGNFSSGSTTLTHAAKLTLVVQ